MKRRDELAAEGYAFAHVIERKRNSTDPRFDALVVGCPYCGLRHEHGGDAGARGVICHRVEHCSTEAGRANAAAHQPGGYWIVDGGKP